MEEKKRLKDLEDWYKDDQLDFDRKLITYRYLSIKRYFKGPRCLELGPADGVQTQYLVNDFENLTIVDGSKTLLDSIPDTSTLTKVHSLFEDYEPHVKFNTIILEHILEHVDRPVELLKKVKNWLMKDGVLIVGVPNANSIHRLIGVEMGLLRNPCELNERDISLGHRRVYTLDTLRKDIVNSGLNIIEEGGVYLKPLSNGQIDKHWDDDLIEAFYRIGNQFPDNTAEIFCVTQI